MENSTRCKPDARYYLESLEELGLEPHEVLMVGNDPKRDIPFPDCGIQTAYVGRGTPPRATWCGSMEDFAGTSMRWRNGSTRAPNGRRRASLTACGRAAMMEGHSVRRSHPKEYTMAEPLSPAERDRTFCDILNRELVCALGCTEPIAVAYAAALARETLGCEPERLELDCSGNIIKNVKSATVPNSGGLAGLEAAATLGAVGGNAASALEVLEDVDDTDRARTRELLARAGYADVSLAVDVPNLYIRVRAHASGHVADVIIAEHHTNVVYRALDGVKLDGAYDSPEAVASDARDAHDQVLSALSLEAIIEFAEHGSIEGGARRPRAPALPERRHLARGARARLGRRGGPHPARQPRGRHPLPRPRPRRGRVGRAHERLRDARRDRVRLGQPGHHRLPARPGVRRAPRGGGRPAAAARSPSPTSSRSM